MQPIDPVIIELLGEPGAQGSVADLSADQLRQAARDSVALYNEGVEQIPVDAVTDERIGDFAVRVYRPDDPTAVFTYFHGGAWITGDLDTIDPVARRISRDTGAIVVSVDYRMLPEHPFPTPFDDAWDATVWASRLRPDLPFVVGGDSAGGTLTGCVALKARDVGGPRIDVQVLIYPGIDDDMDARSVVELGDTSYVSRENLDFFVRNYAGTEAALASPYALPGRAASLAGLPPAVIAVAGHDLLRTSNENYAARLEAAGVPVTVLLDPEQVHSWIDYAPRVASASAAFTRLTDAVNELVTRAVTPA
ncbi:alpha/beta hydrolase [Cryptosporangium sp. NPDC048952]|uniref:alpha/beta hydrolase n=1 Tax=Cryptosporangium sp. NPDC048952 TaxID=3363961 RepID=UPI003713C131